MLKALMNFLSLCWKPFGVDIVGGSSGGVTDGGGGRDGKDGLLWYRDLGKCATGEFSMAVVQANQVLEDQSQIECGPFGTFVGVYDGHGGPETARFVCDHLFRHLQANSAETDGIVTAETIKRAFRATEEGFLDLVSRLWSSRPQIATVGSCCLVGVVSLQTLFVANLGDSRAVLGRKNANTGGVDAVQLTSEHNANEVAVRRELRDLHPDDPQIVMLKHGVWRVKGIIQGSAKRLVKAALHEAARKREMRFSDLQKIDKKVRRHFHDDISVIVLFFNHDLICRGVVQDPPFSIRSAVEH